jgi:hypothetical protein
VLSLYVAVYVVIGVLTAVYFVYPRHDSPAPADAIVVPNGEGGRIQEAGALARAGWAKVLYISVAAPGVHPCQPPQAGPLPGIDVLCFRPDPYTLRGEARFIGEVTRQHGWRRLVVVVSNTQVTRARLRIRRCYTGGLRMVTVRVGRRRLVGSTFYEWGALLKAIVQRGC